MTPDPIHPTERFGTIDEPATQAGRTLLASPLIKASPDYDGFLCDILAIEAEAVKPWREALAGITKRHEWTPSMGPCICDEHLAARALLDEGEK